MQLSSFIKLEKALIAAGDIGGLDGDNISQIRGGLALKEDSRTLFVHGFDIAEGGDIKGKIAIIQDHHHRRGLGLVQSGWFYSHKKALLRSR